MTEKPSHDLADQFMGHLDWRPLQFSEEVWQLWHFLRKLITSSNLSMTGVLTDLQKWIDCDAIMLISKNPEGMQAGLGKWRLWRHITAGARTKLNWEALCNNNNFHLLLDHLLEMAMKTSGSDNYPAILIDFQSSYVLDDNSEVDDAIRHLQALESEKLGLSEFISLTQTIGRLGPIKAYLLGHVAIGDWELGESVLVMANEFTKEDADLGGVRALDDINILPCAIAFSIYLAEVNSNFWRRKQIESLPLQERTRRLNMYPHILREYKRSIIRLMPLLGWANGRDIWQTINTITALKNKEIGADVRRCSIDSQFCRKDGYKVPESNTVDANVQHVQAAWEWARLLEDSKRQLDRLQNHGIDLANDADVKREIVEIISTTNQRLGSLSAVIWQSTDNAQSLQLDGQKLAAFLLCKIAEARVKDEIPKNSVMSGSIEGVGLVERMMLVKHISVVAQYSLGARGADATTLESLLWIISEFGHEALGLDRRIDLERHLHLAAMEQPALYGLKPFYRDHLHHVIQVCLAGWVLLETRLGGENELQLWETVATNMGISVDEQGHKSILRQWFLASLLHDIGYAIEVGNGWGLLLKMFKDPVLTGLQQGVANEINKLTEIVLARNWGFCKEDKPAEDHGVVSALHASELVRELAAQDSLESFDDAIIAMAHHSHCRPILDFGKEPLSVLLVISDELQEWDRPSIDFSKVGLALSAAVVHRTKEHSNWHESIATVTARIQSRWDPQKGVILFSRNSVLHFGMNYKDDIHRQDGIFAAWLGRSANLQRISLANAPFDIRYQLISPLHPPADLDRKNREEPQIERLRRLIRDRRLWDFDKWVPRGLSHPRPDDPSRDNGVEYDLVDGNEMVTLNLRALCSNHPIQKAMNSFWSEMSIWPGSQEGRSLDA